MINYEPPVDPVLEPFLEHGRVIPPVPDIVRSRALARARATTTAAVLDSSTPMPESWKRALLIAVAASIALAIGAAGAVAALLGRTPQAPVFVSPARPAALPSVRTPGPAAPAVAPAIAPQSNSAAPERPLHQLSPQESYAAELKLLERAQATYAARDFGASLALVAEHARRFPNGRLAEEREALRVRSLASSGRTDEAARAATAFARRFPRSILLPRLGAGPR